MELIAKEKPCEIEAMERIGSDSTMGEVYSHKIDNQMIAIKILPIISSRALLNNLKEIELASEVSNLVLEGKSKYFPLVYFDILCDSTFFYGHNESNFAKQSLNYQRYDSEITFDNFKIKSKLLFSEMAYTDLRNHLSEKIDVSILNQIVVQVLQGINDLQNCGIIHKDLHLGNILLLYNPEKEIHILIHDFGKSIKLNMPYKFTNLQFKKDILTFFNEITAYIRNFYDKNSEEYIFIKNKLGSSILVLDETDNKSPILEILKLWNVE
jgi:serine/threonine protein kinase